MIRTLLVVLLIGLVILGVPALSEAAGGGSCKTFIKNGTSQTVYAWVDESGRGLKPDIPTQDGRSAQRLDPNQVACADETNFFDSPTIRIYDAQGRCLYAKEVRYVPIFGGPSHWRWTGSELVKDK